MLQARDDAVPSALPALSWPQRAPPRAGWRGTARSGRMPLSSTFILGIQDSVDGVCHLGTKAAYDAVGHNVGNLAFHYAMTKILGGPQDSLEWHVDPERMNAMARLGVMPCANQIGPHADYGRLADRFATLRIPLVAVGMGAQGGADYALPEVPEGTRRWIEEIAKRSPRGAPNIGLRGPFTLKVLEQCGLGDRAVVTGCPTLFLNPDPMLGRRIAAKAAKPFAHVAMAAGHQKWRQLSALEASLTRILDESGGSYIVQSPIEMVALARGEADSLPEEDLVELRDYARPGTTLDEFKRWSRRHARAFFNISEWMEHLRGVDFVAGTRIHGIVLALQAGTPGLCIAHDSRTRELCETMGVPFIMAGEVIRGTTLEELRSRFVFDGEAFDAHRRAMARTMDGFLQSNALAPSAWLGRIIGS
ncbi:hypothetical protein CKO45_03590 [Paracraurococcus ruber]|uniref:Polysaccharide pyruvyl transferase domain-containing protein n=1 Tax=Paracraurococcus ruber TaxID=77675 RepID=A0ABS1CS74_9PROT|nr:hypothetical protein [Paracraurococcus ruber]